MPSPDNSTGFGSGSLKSVKVLFALVDLEVVDLELSDVREVVESRPRFSMLGLCGTAAAGSSTGLPKGWLMYWLGAGEAGAGELPLEPLAAAFSAAARLSIALRRSRGL